jgi:hypothetical protein
VLFIKVGRIDYHDGRKNQSYAPSLLLARIQNIIKVEIKRDEISVLVMLLYALYFFNKVSEIRLTDKCWSKCGLLEIGSTTFTTGMLHT